MRVHFLSTRGSRRAHSFTYPTRVFAKQLRHADVEVRLFYKDDDPGLTACDVLGVVSDYFGIQHLIARPDEVVQLLKRYQAQVGALIWFDVTDGTGTLFEPAFAVVDLYAKKQALKDRSLYRTAYYEREYHLHYFYEQYGDQLAALGEKARIVNHRGLDDWESEKINLSWNIGLGDYHIWGSGGRRFRSYWPVARFMPLQQEARCLERPIHVSYRVGTKYQFPAVPFHRLQLRRLLAELAHQREGNSFFYEGKVPYHTYLKELTQTRLAPSPFGWGEVCWRDFETFLCGALLLKPAMEHLETWPDYFEPDVTYVAHAWDGSDFQATITALLDDPDRCYAIARTGQKRYQTSLSAQGGDAFTQRFMRLMEEALRNRNHPPA